MAAGWRRFTAGAFAEHTIDGHHLFVMATGAQRAAKEAWLTTIAQELAALV